MSFARRKAAIVHVSGCEGCRVQGLVGHLISVSMSLLPEVAEASDDSDCVLHCRIMPASKPTARSGHGPVFCECAGEEEKM